MLRIILFALLAVGVFARSSLHDVEWNEFKHRFKKIYEPKEEAVRREIFYTKLNEIEEHNAAYRAGKYSYTLGVNKYSDLTSQEFRAQLTGFRPELKRKSGNTYLPPSHVIDLPTTVDWRKEGYVTPVKDQGTCASCWAFSATGSLEGQHFKKTGKLVSLSEQDLVDCARREGNRGCSGGLMDLAFEYVQKNNGIDTEASYPYQAKDLKCRFKREDVGTTCFGYMDLTSGDEKNLQIAVADFGPISVGVDSSYLEQYSSGVLDAKNCSSTALDHGMLVVGYGVYNNIDYWLVKNSWGTSWGMEGYIMMSRNKNNQCGIATNASFPLV